jgi:hypothetical protein
MLDGGSAVCSNKKCGCHFHWCAMTGVHSTMAPLHSNFCGSDKDVPQIPTKYWNGPFGILIPMSIYSVTSPDRCNTVYQDGGETEMFSTAKPYTEQEYKEKHALEIDGKWYWIR